MPRYFLDLPEDSAPRPWDPHRGPRPERADTRYFARAFTAMEARLRDPDVDVYLTWDVTRLPSYGDRVVAVVLGDEAGRIPRYLHRVRAVFKAYGTRPVLGAGPWTGPELAQFGVRWLKWLPGAAEHARHRHGQISVIPLGTFNQDDLPVVPVDERPTDIFFAGSVEHQGGLRGRVSPKLRSRREMLEAVGRLGRARPALRLDLRLTSGFAASAAASSQEYSRALMNARICLAPRGTSLETFRVFEGLRAGCVVVTERLPRHWFYVGAPIIQLGRWSTLDRLPVLDQPAELRRLHADALEWWRDHCSEAAVGAFLADRLNALAADGLRP
jgi:hypothetical protein